MRYIRKKQLYAGNDGMGILSKRSLFAIALITAIPTSTAIAGTWYPKETIRVTGTWNGRAVDSVTMNQNGTLTFHYIGGGVFTETAKDPEMTGYFFETMKETGQTGEM